MFWPYVYYDFFDYVFWPYAYDDFWPYAYGDVYYGIYGPYAYGGSRVGVAAGRDCGGPTGAGWRVDSVLLTVLSCCSRSAPVLAFQPDRTNLGLATLVITNTATDPTVRDAVRHGFSHLYALVSGLSGASDEDVRTWFAMGMLINVLMAIDAPAVEEPWAKALVGE